jgi:hypothetical protein
MQALLRAGDVRCSSPVQIKKGDRIAGVPIEEVRRLVREIGGLEGDFTVDDVRRRLQISTKAAGRLLVELAKLGFAEQVAQTSRRRAFRWTDEVGRLASARLGPPLHRHTAERLVHQVVARARVINANDAYAFVVRRLELFGSVLRGAERPGDVDIAVTIEPRYSGERRDEVFRARIRAAIESGRRFATFFDQVSWPQEEIKRALRGRSRGVSFALDGTPERLGTERQIIFELGGIGDTVLPSSREPPVTCRSRTSKGTEGRSRAR